MLLVVVMLSEEVDVVAEEPKEEAKEEANDDAAEVSCMRTLPSATGTALVPTDRVAWEDSDVPSITFRNIFLTVPWSTRSTS